MNDCIHVIADDYGLSAGIGIAVRELIADGKITGTSCMTLFPEWNEQAELLRSVANLAGADVGLHLTLTDFRPICRPPGMQTMPTLRSLLTRSILGRLDQSFIDAELDAQLGRFIERMGRVPDFIDGHQHVHFLPVVRSWLETRRERLTLNGRLPWLRGAPAIRYGPTRAVQAKIALVSLVASGFDRRLQAAGFPVRGPLLGFYNWKRPSEFRMVMRQLEGGLADATVCMCHPGVVDDMLLSRDGMVEARPVEFRALALASVSRRRHRPPESGS